MVYIYGPRFQMGGWQSRFLRMDFSAQDPRIWSTSDKVVFFSTDKGLYNDIQVRTVFQSSDERYKSGIQSISKALETVQQLRGTSFSWVDDNKLKSGSASAFGFIAQEVELVIPDIVFTDSLGFKSMDYSAIIPITVEAIKDLSLLVENQQREIERLKSQSANGSDNASSIENGHVQDKAVLYSNNPNPFSLETEIGYYLPSETKKAVLLIFDLNGKQVKKLPIYTNGEGYLTVSAGELAVGMYLYTLIADNKEVDTKRMIVL